jgi:CO/xanthine dehydrogenase Mo-binding subunit
VANALFDALGVLVNEVPITPEKVRAVIEGRYRAPRMPDFAYPEVVVVPPLELKPTAFGAVRPG